jgi:hypothetical protein
MTIIEAWLAGASIVDTETIWNANRISGCGWNCVLLERRIRQWLLNHGDCRAGEWYSFYDVCNESYVSAYRQFGKGVVTLLKAAMTPVLEFQGGRVRVRQVPLVQLDSSSQ